jgi:hypothetical protein
MSNLTTLVLERKRLRDKLQLDIDKFLSNGGTITQIPVGYMAKDAEGGFEERRKNADRHPNKLAFSFNASKKDRNLTH